MKFCPTESSFGGGPDFIPHAKSLRILLGDPGFLPHAKFCGFYVGTPVLLIIVCKNRDIWMKFYPTKHAFCGDPEARKPPYSGLAAYLAYVRGLNMRADKAIRRSAPQNMRFAGAPDSAVGNAVIRTSCAPSLSRKTAIFERQTRKSPLRKRERTKAYVTAFRRGF